MSNGRISAVARNHGSAVEVYSEGPGGAVARLRLLLLTAGGEPATRLERVRLVENTRGAVCLAVIGRTPQGAHLAAKFRIKRGEVFVQTEPGPGAGRLRVECPGRFVVLPDFFADDILIDAARIPLPAVEVPTDNFVLHLTGTGDAIGMCAFENRQQDVKIALAGQGEKRTITASEIGFEGKKIWAAVLTSPQVWHQRDLETDDAGEVIPLEWKMPFPAQWRVDFTRKDGLTDSWEMLLQEKKNQKYVKPSWLGGREETLKLNRRRWNTFLDTFPYPCWSDHERQGYLQPLTKEAFQFQGPVVLYPINRVKQTPLDAYTVVDIMRNTLGAGPCEHVLDVEGQRTRYRGRPTCGVQGLLEEIYSEKLQKQKRAEVKQHLNDALSFVTHIRNRISRYIEFAHQMREYLAAQKKAHPELSPSIAELDNLVKRIDTRVAPAAAKIPKPDYVARLNEDFRQNIMNDEGPDALARCKKYGKALTEIGGDQDELVGECRWVVRTLRQRAAIMVALDPRIARIAGEIRARTQEVLRNPAGYEWSRH
ncbi:MAG TPA: hypothetical protein VG013_36335 [Gemmataceae bacterium]|nr:hypothetical protein [Gemmataceae bacterium]